VKHREEMKMRYRKYMTDVVVLAVCMVIYACICLMVRGSCDLVCVFKWNREIRFQIIQFHRFFKLCSKVDFEFIRLFDSN
jgi:hypothetical protein